MPVQENSSLLFTCHLELVISENSLFFACYFDEKTEKKMTWEILLVIFKTVDSRQPGPYFGKKIKKNQWCADDLAHYCGKT